MSSMYILLTIENHILKLDDPGIRNNCRLLTHHMFILYFGCICCNNKAKNQTTTFEAD